MILSLQFTLTIVVCFLYIRLSPYFSIAHKWLTGLEFCIPPEEKQLERLDFNPLLFKRRKSKKIFDFKKNEIELRVAAVEDNTLNKHIFWEEYDQLVLVLTCVVINFLFSEFWACFTTEKNTIMTALLLFSAGMCTKTLLSVVVKLGLQSYDELRLTIFVGVVSFMHCLLFLSLPEWTFDFGADLKKGFIESSASLNDFLEKNEISMKIDIPYQLFTMFICLIASIAASALFSPAFRLARSYFEITKYTPKPYHPYISWISFWLPLPLMLLWIKPLVRDWIVASATSTSPYLLSDGFFEMFRFTLIMILCALRLYLMRPYLQSFLGTAVGWAEVLLSETKMKERGKNIKYKILGIYSCLCVAAVQLLAPTLMLLSFAFMLKSRGLSDVEILPFCASSQMQATGSIPNLFLSDFTSVVIFTPVFYKGFFSFMCWWTIFSFFLISLLALFYERRQNIFAKRESKAANEEKENE